mmetsp:Transcript_22497/g.74590  ORF Transcript_22497/g.74590 Transcript_22497/m.74590 type:complete len:290 (-) Transcript_22497:3810-4679(-)
MSSPTTKLSNPWSMRGLSAGTTPPMTSLTILATENFSCSARGRGASAPYVRALRRWHWPRRTASNWGKHGARDRKAATRGCAGAAPYKRSSASSMAGENRAWAMVPENPKDESRAPRTSSSVASVGSTGGAKGCCLRKEPRWPLRRFKSGFGGMGLRTRDVAARETTPAPDAPDSRWPMMALRDVARAGFFALPQSVFAAAPTSMGSPSAVPVPCVSTFVKVSFGAWSRASARSSRCATADGAVIDAVRPSLRRDVAGRSTPPWRATSATPSKASCRRMSTATTPSPRA